MGHAPQTTDHSPLIGQPAPDAILPKTDGTSVSVISSRHGQKAIIIFWATWCPHCYEDLGTVNAHIAQAEQKGIKIILVDIGETKDVVKDYFQRRQMNLTSFVDEDSTLQGPYRLVGVPTLFFIDEKGLIRNVKHAFPSDYQNFF